MLLPSFFLESEEPPSKKRLIKTEAVNQEASSQDQGHLLVNASDGSQVCFILVVFY